jgi:hypothetical protein
MMQTLCFIAVLSVGYYHISQMIRYIHERITLLWTEHNELRRRVEKLEKE